MSTVAARSVFRSAASRISSAAKPKATASSFRIPTQKPVSSRILRKLSVLKNHVSGFHYFSSPVTMSSFCLESMLPYHTATASALLTSMLSAAPRHYGWTLEGQEQTA